jgi:NhaP-type Na+/H+ or K+/H+ antiporter
LNSFHGRALQKCGYSNPKIHESPYLINNGIGVVIFTILYGIAAAEHAFSSGSIALLFARETLVGTALGLVLGGGASWSFIDKERNVNLTGKASASQNLIRRV